MNNITFPPDIKPRPLYLERVLPFIGKSLIKVFTGQRRVGKSYLLFQVMKWITTNEKDATIIYVNKEDLLFSFIRTAKDLHDYITNNTTKKGKTYVFIDEIQDIQDFEKALRSLLLHQHLDIYCTGSNANLLSGELSGMLSGRYIEITVYSLSYNEFKLFHNEKGGEKTIEKYLKFGGLPYLRHLELKDEIVFEYLKNIYSTIIYRDIINRYSIRNTLFLEQLVLFIAGNTGSLFSAKKISDFLKSQQIKIPANLVQSYLKYLSSSFIIHKVQRYDIVGKRIFEIGEKFYFENLGIRHALWGYRPEDRGKIMENAVFNHLLAKGYNAKVGSIGAEEIDFVCEKDGEKRYVQVALTINEERTLKREFGNLQKIEDNYPKEVITMDAFKGNTFLGIKTYSLEEFLET